MIDSPNPAYKVHQIQNCFPFRVDSEMIGATAGRIYFREQNRLIVVTASDHTLRVLRDQLTKLLEEAEHDAVA